MWEIPVCDRTPEDVYFALQKLEEWTLAELTGNPPETYPLKGCVNRDDLNRIEGNIKWLADRLSELGYPSGVHSRTWELSDLPTGDDILRILGNLTALTTAYYLPEGVRIPRSMAVYSEINDIEYLLLRLRELSDCMISCFIKTGSIKAGQARILPLRR